MLPAHLQKDFETLISFLENHAFDKLLYWCVAIAHNPQAIIEIQWHKQEPLPWRLRERGKLFWQSVSREHLAAALAGFDVDWEKLLTAWRDTVRQQVIYARVVLNEAEQTFGQDFVQESIREHEELMQALLQALKNMDEQQQEGSMPLAAHPAKGSPRLTLVKPAAANKSPAPQFDA